MKVVFGMGKKRAYIGYSMRAGRAANDASLLEECVMHPAYWLCIIYPMNLLSSQTIRNVDPLDTLILLKQ
jgi:hypothetical protein